MITNVKNVQVFTADQLSNEDYHGHENISGSSLCHIYKECPADFKFKEPEEKPSAALLYGTASHAAWLEPEMFDREFVCGLNKDDYPNTLTSDAAIKAELKKRGLTGYSKYTGNDLINFCIYVEEYKCEQDKNSYNLDLDIWSLRLNLHDAKNTGKVIVPFQDYEDIMKMRRVLFADNDVVELMKGAQVEMSIICDVEIDGEWHGIKIRPDIITAKCEVPDYKTVASMRPDKFGRDAYEFGYWLKQAFVTDVLKAVYGNEFKPGLIAQGKKSPFIHQLYWMTRDQMQVGREQYLGALKQYSRCKEADLWPAYFDTAVELPTPDYIAKRYGF